MMKLIRRFLRYLDKADHCSQCYRKTTPEEKEYYAYDDNGDRHSCNRCEAKWMNELDKEMTTRD